MKISRDYLRFYSIPIVLFAGILITAAFTVLCAATSRTPEGKIVGNNWPREFTKSFSAYITCADGVVAVSGEGQKQLAENGLWLQVLDADGREAYSQNKPAGTPDTYQPYALLQTYQYGDGHGSVFVGSVDADGASYTYLVGFPLSISKVTVYVDNARYQSGKVLIVTVIVLTAILVVTLTIYSYRTFSSAEQRRARDEQAREEWLVNITHDLKTPLSPIAGYAELLQEPGSDVTPEQARRYGGVILKNARYAEALVGDLKLTYQLKSGMLPLRKSKQNVTRFAREVVIDVLNAPDFAGREAAFASVCEDAEAAFDPLLMKRALTNILVNALTHGGNEAAVSVCVARSGGSILLKVQDDGGGMEQSELEKLFTRYYRGASSEAKCEGSGLGMAISRQIAEAHGGNVSAQSEPGKGTEITLRLPAEI